MPELPEVRTVVLSLQPFVGWTIRQIELHQPAVLCDETGLTLEVFVGYRIAAITAHGKQIWFTFSRGPRLLAHLGMTGQFRRHEPGRPKPKHAHVVFRLQKGGTGPICELHFIDPRRFGGLWLVHGQERKDELGPDACRMTRTEFEQALIGRKRQLKALLLDQRRLAGLGNIYADESLHRAGLHPLRRNDQLTQIQRDRLFKAIKTILRSAVRLGGSTLDDYRDANGDQGWFQTRHRVYGRAGQPCRTCGTKVVSAPIAGRTTCWCPKCQKR